MFGGVSVVGSCEVVSSSSRSGFLETESFGRGAEQAGLERVDALVDVVVDAVDDVVDEGERGVLEVFGEEGLAGLRVGRVHYNPSANLDFIRVNLVCGITFS